MRVCTDKTQWDSHAPCWGWLLGISDPQHHALYHSKYSKISMIKRKKKVKKQTSQGLWIINCLTCQALDWQIIVGQQGKHMYKWASSLLSPPALHTWLSLIKFLINYTNLHLMAGHFWDISKEYLLMEEKKKNFSNEHLKLVPPSRVTPSALLLCSNGKTGSQFGHVFYSSFSLSFLIPDESSSPSSNLIGMYYMSNFLNLLILIQISLGFQSELDIFQVLS